MIYKKRGFVFEILIDLFPLFFFFSNDCDITKFVLLFLFGSERISVSSIWLLKDYASILMIIIWQYGHVIISHSLTHAQKSQMEDSLWVGERLFCGVAVAAHNLFYQT